MSNNAASDLRQPHVHEYPVGESASGNPSPASAASRLLVAIEPKPNAVPEPQILAVSTYNSKARTVTHRRVLVPLPSQGEGGQDRLSRAEELLRLMLADDEMVAANSYGRRDNPKSIEREWKRMWPDQFKLVQSVRDFLYAKESSQTPAPTRRSS